MKTGFRSPATYVLIGLGIALAVLATVYADLLSAAFRQNPHASAPESAERGKILFLRDCAACHGPKGQGDGTVALPERPDDLTTIAESPIFPDGVLAYRIEYGRGLMPTWKDTLTDSEIWDLVSYIRSVGLE